MPNKKNEVSGLMIMGLFGGTVFPLLMGVLTDLISSQVGALIILGIGVIYLALFSLSLKNIEKTQ